MGLNNPFNKTAKGCSCWLGDLGAVPGVPELPNGCPRPSTRDARGARDTRAEAPCPRSQSPRGAEHGESAARPAAGAGSESADPPESAARPAAGAGSESADPPESAARPAAGAPARGRITAPGLPRASGSAARPHGRPSPPIRAVRCRGRAGAGRAVVAGRSRRGRARAAPAVPQGRATSRRKAPGSGGMGNVRDGGGVARGLLALLVSVALLIIETQCKNDTEALITSNRRIISRREVNCQEDEYNLDADCCKKCRSGFVKNVPCPKDIVKHCAPCEKGKEFMNHPNDLDKCLRCKLCDSNFGLKVVKNCTPEEDTQCACAKNYFCSPAGCDNCIQCSTCESGVIEKQCTPASDTVCGTKEPETLWWIVALVVLVIAAAIAAAIAWYKRKQKGLTINDHPINGVYKPEPYENELLIYADADLSSHIPGIVEEMTLKDVKKFVRHHHISEPAIDQSIQDCPGDTSEQKIRLFQAWYQSHGMKGAYGTLISSLRELKMCTVADKIEGKLKAAISSSQEGGQSYNPDTEQSKICTQEGRNSYNESAELSKTYTASLEET
ncbi:tumor necrosis factor receptor superfamily member 6 [Anomalospiza imberbis]|uniref:tumor necrosis factor receptor superfamily member 6 n=1 Tax=Anomalospiza imberbis TaxID=187417 RepID=UPI00358F9A13